MRLNQKKILLGVTGSIAAYKTPELVRLLIKEGATVQVVMTSASKDFVSPLALSTVSTNQVLSDFTVPDKTEWVNHVKLGLWADLFLVVPASANTIAKFSNGLCDNLLSAVYLSARCPVMIAPAMDVDMYHHPATQNNIQQLQKYGNMIIGPEKGELASGLNGDGRMTNPDEILSYIIRYFEKGEELKGKRALVTAGPTFEAIDPVRFIGNHSSGKMGIALAKELADRGALVTLITGPKVQKVMYPKVRQVEIVSADDMHKACVKEFPGKDITIMTAAVADFTPAVKSDKKIKKGTSIPVIELKHTVDVLSELGKMKKKKQTLVGFALETNDEIENAKKKLKNKNLDFIVLNSMNDKGATFNSELNKITIIDLKENITPYELKTKEKVAVDIIDRINSVKHD